MIFARSILMVLAGLLVMAPGVLARTHDEVQAPRAQEIQAPRGQEIQAPRSDERVDVPTPRR